MENKRVVFIAPCMLAPGLQVYSGSRKENWGKQFVELLMKNDIDIIPLACVESSFKGYNIGINRKKHGIDFYIKEDGFCEHCLFEAEQDAQKIFEIVQSNYSVLCIIGIEHSPSCAVNYLYSHRGTIKTMGLFMDSLKKKLLEKGTDIEFVGINRKYPRKALERITEIIKTVKDTREVEDDYNL